MFIDFFFFMNEIHRAIPHRPPFLFLDEIVSERPDGMIARRTFRARGFLFCGALSGQPHHAGGDFFAKAAFQAAAVFLVRKMRAAAGEKAEGLTPVLSRIGEAKFASAWSSPARRWKLK